MLRIVAGAAFVLWTVASAGCATGGSARTDRVPRGDQPRASTTITELELARFHGTLSLEEAIRQARPWYLSGRGRVPAVSVDDGPAMEISVLRFIPVSDVHEVRLQRASSSLGKAMVTPTGDIVIGDVLYVTTKRR
jgi:hypothetical protein